MMKSPLHRWLALTATLCLSHSLLASEYYVAPSGSDSANGSRGNPWKSIQHAATKVEAGDTVLVAPGEYQGVVTIKQSGTESSPIHFKSFKPREALVEGFKLDGDYITIEGFEITSDKNDFGVHAGEAHRKNARKGCKILNNYIHDVSGTAIYSGTDGLVKDNLMKNVGRGVFANSGTLVEGNEVDTLVPSYETKNGKKKLKKTQYNFFCGDDITFRNNYLHGAPEQGLIDGMGVCFFTTYDAWIYGPSHNILVEGNRCFNATHASEPSGTARKESSNFIFRNNLFVNTVYVGILCQQVEKVIVENNTFINCGAYPVWFQKPRETQGSVVKNNIIAYIGRDEVVSKYGWKPAESAIRNNLHPKSPVETSNNLIWKSTNREYSDTDFVADPMFVDPANHDYRLKPGSPAIDAGEPLAHIDTDLRGVKRPQGGKPDIGAYEYTPTEDK